MTVVKLTRRLLWNKGGENVGYCYVNLDRVAYVYRNVDDTTTFIQFSELEDDWITVDEKPEQFYPGV